MAYSSLSVTAPTGTTYDPENPTQGTEELNMTLHAILQDMEDAGLWYLHDDYVGATPQTNATQRIHDMIEDAFDYVEGAIDTYRENGTPTLAKPTATTIVAPYQWFQEHLNKAQWECYTQCMKVCYFAYYMWKTETDPLRVKDYIRDMLLAWPLQDVTIDLADDGGSQIKLYPQWNNIES
jgi:hypothetical protein